MNLAIILLGFVIVATTAAQKSEIEGIKFLENVQKRKLISANKQTIAAWNHESDITEQNLQIKIAADLEAGKIDKEIWGEVNQFDWLNFKNESVRRQFQKLSKIGEAALSAGKLEKLNNLISNMSGIYSQAKICDYHDLNNCELRLSPDLEEIMAKSTNPEELKHVWDEWRKESGRKCKMQFTKMVKLLNEAAKLNNFSNYGDYVLDDYEDINIREQFELLWLQIKPYYEQLHGYVRFKLRQIYGEDVVSEKGPIPAHLLGNMWAQTWGNIAKRTLPLPHSDTTEDVTSEMQKQGYTPLKIFKLSEDFFISLNLTAMPEKFWKNSIIERIPGREMVCHASAWDFYDGEDFRIKECTVITEEELRVVHHEMGHIQYYLQYKHLPFVFRSGANEGFHEAVGDTIALSVGTEKHLKRIGLIKQINENDLNHLYQTLLEKLPFLPFGYLMDLYRWDIYNGKITKVNNCDWWKLREKYQGIEPPIDRTVDDFDPASKYHIVANVPYIRYFVSYIIQFQFHKSLCLIANEYDPNDNSKPLHRCDIYKNMNAGNLLHEMLSLGSSKPWPEALKIITGANKMDASGILEYFKPILDFIKLENQRNNVFIGWESTKRKIGNCNFK